MKSPRASDEFKKIYEIQGILGKAGPRVSVGIGDDAAVLAPSLQPLLFCSDVMVETIHFRSDWTTPAQLGFKAVMACASDIAAMNGQWLYSTISIALPQHLQEQNFLKDFYLGVKKAADLYGADVVGGDLTSSPSLLFLDVACIGACSHPVRRSGAQVGDQIMVSGNLGSSKAGFEILNSEMKHLKLEFPSLLRAHLEPCARLDLIKGLSLETELITSMIDVSDGLSSELHHLAQASGLHFQIDETNLPFDKNLPKLAEKLCSPHGASIRYLDWILDGGEDYQLLATMNMDRHTELQRDSPDALAGWTRIGEVSVGSGVTLRTQDQTTRALVAKGFRHF